LQFNATILKNINIFKPFIILIITPKGKRVLIKDNMTNEENPIEPREKARLLNFGLITTDKQSLEDKPRQFSKAQRAIEGGWFLRTQKKRDYRTRRSF